GFRSSEKEFGVKLIGGNLSSSEKLFLDVTTLGEVEPENLIRRSGASPGDVIYVSGTLGDAALGLKLLEDGRTSGESSYLVGRHLNPEPRLALGRRLALAGAATSMIDVSDGLMLDLERITVQQGAGARIDLDRIPVSDEYRKHASGNSDEFFACALGGGEDYELLFTSSPGRRDDIREISAALDILITEIGEVVSVPAIKVIDRDGKEVTVSRKGFIHFGA
ncbi:MAG TPA: thiamine-phosphate kinase, partial [Thermodesulfobacteriota bacterium]|nr:thiamine-phosphate kinase [Thermodesulfobacteriota bacterium]